MTNRSPLRRRTGNAWIRAYGAPAIVALLGLMGCDAPSSGGAGVEPSAPPLPNSSASAISELTKTNVGDDRATPRCDEVPIWEGGKAAGTICQGDAAEAGLTVVNLADDWAPRILEGDVEQRVPYRETYVRIANEDFGDDPVWDRAQKDRYFEVYGIFPSLTVVRTRLYDDARHTCHDAIDNSGLAQLRHNIDTWKPKAVQRADQAVAKVLKTRLQKVATERGMASIDELAGTDGEAGAFYAKYYRIESRQRAIAAMVEHLECEKLYDKSKPGAAAAGFLDGRVIDAMQTFHRRHMIVSWQLDEETRKALSGDSREYDFLTALRVLRERVVDATGLVEDGTASDGSAEVVGRTLDAQAFSHALGGETPVNGATDRIGRATDAAARALGWSDPSALKNQLANALPSRVAIALPPPPAYHSAHMELDVVIDRGDVWYDFPFTAAGDRFVMPRAARPSITVVATHEGKRIPLVRWPTTIGGWQPERVNGRTMLMYKESPDGPRVYRDIVAAPRWIPPRSTPTRDLLRPRGKGQWVPKYDAFGPHYASAYGIAMIIHHRVGPTNADGTKTMFDLGIRTHGSASYDSILDGYSHGCHRLHNHRAVRLTSFLLAHRTHRVAGPIELDFHRTLYYRRSRTNLHFDSRGFRYELTPPIEVDVRPGRIMGSARPPAPRALPSKLLKRYGFR